MQDFSKKNPLKETENSVIVLLLKFLTWEVTHSVKTVKFKFAERYKNFMKMKFLFEIT